MYNCIIHGVCPNCGYCPHCGRGARVRPRQPWPRYPWEHYRLPYVAPLPKQPYIGDAIDQARHAIRY
jgi:hypothetical protein